MKSKFLKDKLARYQNGELSIDEKEIIDQWFSDQLKASENELPQDRAATEQLHKELLKRLKTTITPAKKAYQLTYRWIGIASSFVLLVGITVWYQHRLPTDEITTDPAGQYFNTANGKIKKITLKDGTEIWMNAGTTLRIADNFSSSTTRKVYLEEGEAFFKVKRDTLRPFSIATKNLLTTVLGTSFNIRTYPAERIYQVAVSTGKVKVTQKNNKNWTLLSPGLVKGEVLTYHINSSKVEIASQHADLISNWQTDRSIYADGLTITEIGQEISRQYDISVQVNAGRGENRKYHLLLPHRDLKILLQQLAVTTGINYQLTHDQLIINPATL